MRQNKARNLSGNPFLRIEHGNDVAIAFDFVCVDSFAGINILELKHLIFVFDALNFVHYAMGFSVVCHAGRLSLL